MRNYNFDVVVVGAGPAGSATSIYLRQMNPNLRVALVDKASFPRDKACGDGLGPASAPYLRTLGVYINEVEHANWVQMAEVHGPDGLSISADLTELELPLSCGITVRRMDFDHLLVNRAETLGVERIEGARFVGISSSENANRIVANFTNGKTSTRLSCALLVGADGANSRVRRAVNVARNPPHRTGVAIRAYGHISGNCADRIVLSFDDDLLPGYGYGWCFPFSDGTANVGLGMTIKDYRNGSPNLSNLLANYLERLGHRGISITNTTDYATYILPHGGKLPKLTSGRVALVGDAGSMINPLSGEGIVYGLAAGQMLAAATAHRLERWDELNAGLDDYERTFKREFAHHFRSNFIAQRILRSRLWAKVAFGCCSRDASSQSAMVDFMFGKGVLTAPIAYRMIRHGGMHLISEGRSRKTV